MQQKKHAVTRSQERRQEVFLQTFVLCAAMTALALCVANVVGWLGENEKDLLSGLLGGFATLVVAA